MVWSIKVVCKNMAKIGIDPEPDLESKIWRLTGYGFVVLVFKVGSGFGVSFSDFAHLCHLWTSEMGGVSYF